MNFTSSLKEYQKKLVENGIIKLSNNKKNNKPNTKKLKKD
jgi:hypothetical protein